MTEKKIKGKSGYALRQVAPGVRRWVSTAQAARPARPAARPAPQASPDAMAMNLSLATRHIQLPDRHEAVERGLKMLDERGITEQFARNYARMTSPERFSATMTGDVWAILRQHNPDTVDDYARRAGLPTNAVALARELDDPNSPNRAALADALGQLYSQRAAAALPAVTEHLGLMAHGLSVHRPDRLDHLGNLDFRLVPQPYERVHHGMHYYAGMDPQRDEVVFTPYIFTPQDGLPPSLGEFKASRNASTPGVRTLRHELTHAYQMALTGNQSTMGVGGLALTDDLLTGIARFGQEIPSHSGVGSDLGHTLMMEGTNREGVAYHRLNYIFDTMRALGGYPHGLDSAREALTVMTDYAEELPAMVRALDVNLGTEQQRILSNIWVADMATEKDDHGQTMANAHFVPKHEELTWAIKDGGLTPAAKGEGMTHKVVANFRARRSDRQYSVIIESNEGEVARPPRPVTAEPRAFAAPGERKIKGKSGYALRQVAPGVRRWVSTAQSTQQPAITTAAPTTPRAARRPYRQAAAVPPTTLHLPIQKASDYHSPMAQEFEQWATEKYGPDLRYHGTRDSRFMEFLPVGDNPGQTIPGLYFADSAQPANYYRGSEKDGRLLAVRLHAENPLDLLDEEDMMAFAREHLGIEDEDMDALMDAHYGGMLYQSALGNVQRDILNTARSLGHDMVIHADRTGWMGHPSYVTFKPSQVELLAEMRPDREAKAPRVTTAADRQASLIVPGHRPTMGVRTAVGSTHLPDVARATDIGRQILGRHNDLIAQAGLKEFQRAASPRAAGDFLDNLTPNALMVGIGLPNADTMRANLTRSGYSTDAMQAIEAQQRDPASLIARQAATNHVIRYTEQSAMQTALALHEYLPQVAYALRHSGMSDAKIVERLTRNLAVKYVQGSVHTLPEAYFLQESRKPVRTLGMAASTLNGSRMSGIPSLDTMERIGPAILQHELTHAMTHFRADPDMYTPTVQGMSGGLEADLIHLAARDMAISGNAQRGFVMRDTGRKKDGGQNPMYSRLGYVFDQSLGQFGTAAIALEGTMSEAPTVLTEMGIHTPEALHALDNHFGTGLVNAVNNLWGFNIVRAPHQGDLRRHAEWLKAYERQHTPDPKDSRMKQNWVNDLINKMKRPRQASVNEPILLGGPIGYAGDEQ